MLEVTLEKKELSRKLKIVGMFHWYSYHVAQGFILIVPLLIAGTLFYFSFNPPLSITRFLMNVWLFLAVNALIIMLTTIAMYICYRSDLKNLKRRGKPIESLKGMEQVSHAMLMKTLSTFILTLLAFFSFVLYYASISWNLVSFFYASVSLVLITFGLAILLKIPKSPAFQPGGLLEYYTPREFPVLIDNLFMDTLEAFLDPLSWIKSDEYLEDLEKVVRLKKFDYTKTDLERAFEKIMLLNYMKVRMPDIINEEIIKDEVTEVISESHYDLIADSPYLSFKNIRKLLTLLQSRSPEIATLVDRLYMLLLDNLDDFKKKDLIVCVTAPREVKGLRRFGVVVFLLNNSDEFREKRRPVTIRCVSQGFYPSVSVIQVTLDPKEDFEIVSDQLPIFSEEGEDIVGTLPKVLQIGDAVWFSLIPTDYGKYVVRIEVLERGELIYGESLVVTVKRDLVGIARLVSGSGSIIGGLGTILSKMLALVG